FNPIYIYQNKEDQKEVILSRRTYCIEGSSVNEDIFKYKMIERTDDESNKITFLFVSRLIKEKGVMELVEGFKKALEKNKEIKLNIVGYIDDKNPSSIDAESFNKIIRSIPEINFLGKRKDIHSLIVNSDVCCLPSYYREGTPRFMLEALSTGRAIITSNMPGCNHLIKNNGILLNKITPQEISKAILDIVEMDLTVMGKNSFKLYKSVFSEDVVFNKIYEVYLQ
ncbi:MAG: glycosyltransferase, partial [Flavobacteriales bacterium]|nr:glycosyltransferase [Flavobacteriales bacterium]